MLMCFFIIPPLEMLPHADVFLYYSPSRDATKLMCFFIIPPLEILPHADVFLYYSPSRDATLSWCVSLLFHL